jgi:ketosteroid isomerase-like protein
LTDRDVPEQPNAPAGMTTAQRYRAAVEGKDLPNVRELLAEDIVFHSPVTFHPFLGRETVTALLAEVIQVFEDFRFTDELEMDGAHALIFRANVAGSDREIEGIDLLRFDDDGLIADFTVMLRPMSALVPFAQAMGERAQAAGLQTTRA